MKLDAITTLTHKDSCQRDVNAYTISLRWKLGLLDAIRLSYSMGIWFSYNYYSAKVNSKTWEVTFPDGHKETVFNLNQFCKDNSNEQTGKLDQGNLTRTNKVRGSTYKGFSCRLIE